MQLNRVLDSVFILAFLVGFYPAIFFISNNWFFVGALQSVLLLIAVPLSAFVALTILHFILSRTRLSRDTQSGLLIIVAVLLLTSFMKVTLDELQKTFPAVDIRLAIFLVVSLVIVALLVLSRRLAGLHLNLVRFGNVFLMFLSAAALANLAFSLVANFDKFSAETAHVTAAGAAKQDSAIYRQVKFRSTPDIYLIVPDSYPSNPILQRFFGTDNREFTHRLESAGFTVYDDYFSSYPYSMESMHSMLAMQHNYFANSIGNDSINLREIIGGNGNAVVNILRQNGYRSIYLHDSDYLVHNHCRITACLPQWSELKALKDNAKEFFDLRLPIPDSDYAVNDAMRAQIASTDAGSKTFVYKHFMDAHSNVKSYKKRYRRLLPKFRREYPARIDKVNDIILEEVEQILARDPAALIIVVGDHGTWAGADRSRSGLKADETRDKLDVFLAIRWGQDYDGRYDDRIRTSVNLFRFIFAYLGQDEKILTTLKEDDGYVKYKGKVWKVVGDGKVLDKPVRH